MRIRLLCYASTVVCLIALIGVAATASAPVHAQPAAIPRPEHPRPDFVRSDWQTLNGPWQFEFDDEDRGLAERWYAGERRFSRTIAVPFAFQSKLSGIGDTAFHDVVWYRRAFDVPASWTGRRVLLDFGAVDDEAARRSSVARATTARRS